MLDRTDNKSTMLFAPIPRKRRLQLRISERRLLLMAGDALAVIASVLISLRIWAFVAELRFDMQLVVPEIAWFFVLTGLWFLIASANDFYELSIAANRILSLQRLVVITFQLLVVYLLVFFLSAPGSLPRLFILYYGLSSFTLVALWRLLNPALIGWASAPRRVLVVGTDEAARTIIDVLRREASTTYQVLGVISTGQDADLDNSQADQLEGLQTIAGGDDLLRYGLAHDVREIIVTSTRELSHEIFRGVMDAYEHGIAITPMPILYERVAERVPVEHMGAHWPVVLPMGSSSILNPYPILKRLFDVLLSLIGLVIFSVLLPFIAAALYLDSPGSIFYRQIRVGLAGKPFKIIKFRTMIPDAEKVSGAVWAQDNDPRITRVGRILRKTRLDESPQLINVLRGEMSLIGPRPERPEMIHELEQAIPFYRTRHTVRPGVTGWAQVRYKYGANVEDALIKLQYDLYYIRHQSLLLDANILVRTVGKAVRMEGV
jgi:exopolysaccharide biosynthesis polyprenyl glycosylphosphotransferase